MSLAAPLVSASLLSSYKDAGLLCNVSIHGKTSRAGEFAYRGDLVLEEGEIADAQGRRMPPISVVRQGIVLANETKLTLLVGGLHELAQLDKVFERYSKDFDAGIHLVFFVENIGKPMLSELQGFKLVLLPIADTAVWNETIEELRLEKNDFKCQYDEDKVITLQKAFATDYKPKYETVTWQDALGMTIQVKREGRGPV